MENFKQMLVLYIGLVLFTLFITTIGGLFIGFEYFIKMNIITDLFVLFCFLIVNPFMWLLGKIDDLIN